MTCIRCQSCLQRPIHQHSTPKGRWYFGTVRYFFCMHDTKGVNMLNLGVDQLFNTPVCVCMHTLHTLSTAVHYHHTMVHYTRPPTHLLYRSKSDTIRLLHIGNTKYIYSIHVPTQCIRVYTMYSIHVPTQCIRVYTMYSIHVPTQCIRVYTMYSIHVPT